MTLAHIMSVPTPMPKWCVPSVAVKRKASSASQVSSTMKITATYQA